MRRPSGNPSQERSRRAFARRQWARRWLRWKFVLAGLLVVALLAGGVWLLWFSSIFAVTKVEVTGLEDLREQQVLSVVGVTSGDQLVGVDPGDVESRVEAIADVREARVSRKWPDTVVIEVVEREPIAVVEVGGRLRGLDAEGAVFDRFAKPPADLPRVQTAPDAGREALQEAAAVVEALPADLAARVDHVEVATVDQISLVLRDGRTVVWGSAADSDLKAEVLVAMVANRPEADIDVSVPGRPSFLP